jgi:hypothetical protein
MAITVTPCTPGASSVKSNGFAAGTITLSGLNGGTNFPAGSKVVILLGNDQSALLPTSFQLANGTTLTKVIGDSTGNERPALYYADLAMASVDSVSFTNGSSYNLVGAAAWYLTGAAAGNASSTGALGYPGAADPPGNSVSGATIAAGGAALIGLGSFNNATSTTQTISWSGGGVNAGGDFIERINPGLILGGTSTTTPGSPTVVGAGAGGTFNFIAGMVMAAWAAAAVAPAAPPIGIGGLAASEW